MSSSALEAFLAKLYTDSIALERFLANPEKEATNAGLAESEIVALCSVDRAGLQMAAASYAHKREQHKMVRRSNSLSLLDWITRRLN